MASVAQALAEQLENPHGAWGPAVGALMRLVNRRPNSLALEALGVRPDDDVLELGFGPGEGLKALARRSPRGIVHGIDQSPAMLAQATSRNRREVAAGRVRLSLARFEATGLADCSIDRILAVNVAYFWPDGPAVLCELDRILRPGGRVCLYVTEAATMSRWAFTGSGRHRLFDAAALEAMLAEGPFPRSAVRVTREPLPFGMTGLLGRIDKP